jgi:hypothetical protein
MPTSNVWSLELSRRLRGTKAGMGRVRQQDSPEVVRLKKARQQLASLRQQSANGRNEGEVRAALKEFDAALRVMNIRGGCCAPINP